MKITEQLILQVILKLAESVIDNGAINANATIEFDDADDSELGLFIEMRRKNDT